MNDMKSAINNAARGRFFPVACPFSLVLLFALIASGQQPQALTMAAAHAVTDPVPASARPSALAQPMPDPSEPLHLLVGRSLVITAASRVTRVSIADPTVIDAMVVNPTQVLINGKAPGAVSLVLWDESGQSQSFDVFVDMDVQGLSAELKAIFPNQSVRVETQKDAIILSGMADSQAIADKMLDMAKAASPKAVSLIQVPAPTSAEILLQVRFAEVDRGAITQLGANILSLPGANNIGSISTQQYGGAAAPLWTTPGSRHGRL